MITVAEAIKIQQILIDQFGGSTGLRNRDLLESALARPYQSFDGKDLYPNPEDKAAAIVESLIVNHPFIDGNKRIGYVLMRVILLENNLDLKATMEEKYNFIIAISKGDMKYAQIKEWIHLRIIEHVP